MMGCKYPHLVQEFLALLTFAIAVVSPKGPNLVPAVKQACQNYTLESFVGIQDVRTTLCLGYGLLGQIQQQRCVPYSKRRASRSLTQSGTTWLPLNKVPLKTGCSEAPTFLSFFFRLRAETGGSNDIAASMPLLGNGFSRISAIDSEKYSQIAYLALDEWRPESSLHSQQVQFV